MARFRRLSISINGAANDSLVMDSASSVVEKSEDIDLISAYDDGERNALVL